MSYALLTLLSLSAGAAPTPPDDVTLLVRLLDDDEFDVREAATARLLELGVRSRRVKGRLLDYQQHHSPEVRRRTAWLHRKVAGERLAAIARALDARVKHYPMVDLMWYCEHTHTLNWYNSPSSTLIHTSVRYFIENPSEYSDYRPPPLASYPSLRRATRDWLVAQIEGGHLSVDLAVIQCDELWRKERVWTDKTAQYNPYNYDPSYSGPPN